MRSRTKTRIEIGKRRNRGGVMRRTVRRPLGLRIVRSMWVADLES